MDNVYVIGGLNILDWYNTATCFMFDTKILKWKEISRMNDTRKHSASSIFEGRIIVSGGNNNFGRLKTVEAYDHVGDTWENMPNMVNERICHKSVAVKNKFFVICGYDRNSCEVFDSTTNKFTLIKQPTLVDFTEPYGVITNSNNLLMFRENCNVTIYDFEKDEWAVKTCEATRNIRYFSCVAVPM